MKLIIQIPCFNEAPFLRQTIQALPRTLAGVDTIQILVIDDGSEDDTALIAQEAGAHHLLRLPHHSGLAASFAAGLEASLRNGADIIVNTDADNQYFADDLQKLIDPILARQAEITVGDRGVASLERFSAGKRLLSRIGSWVVGKTAGFPVPDAASGFRAFSREAALRTLVLSEYSYTLETLIQAGSNHLSVQFVPVRTNPQTRPSRLMRSVPNYVTQSGNTILRAYTMYRPLRVFSIISWVLISGGLLLGIRFLYFFIMGSGSGHIQSLILAAVLLIIGFQTFLIGLVADLIGFNRRMLEELVYRLKKMEFKE